MYFEKNQFDYFIVKKEMNTLADTIRVEKKEQLSQTFC
jgi:hypothetical protein